MASLHLEVVTPDRIVLTCETQYVGITGVEGEFGVMPGHIPFLSALAIGSVHYIIDGKIQYIFISGGFSEVSDNKVSVLAESAELVSEIDPNRAEQARERAISRLETIHSDTVDAIRAETALKRATIRLDLKGIKLSS